MTKTTMKTAPITGKMTVMTRMGKSECGTSVPTINLFGNGATERARNARLHQIAAEIELATPPAESWIVQCDISRDRVSIELGTDENGEADRAMAILQRVAAKF